MGNVGDVDEIRIEVRLKNNRLYEAIVPVFGSVAEFCRRSGMNQCEVGALINLRASPFRSIGGPRRLPQPEGGTRAVFAREESPYTATARRLAEIAGYSCEEVFPLDLYEKVVSPKVVKTISLGMALEYDQRRKLLSGESAERYDDGALSDALVMKPVLETLTDREADVIRQRFGFKTGSPMELSEVGRNLWLSSNRISQIEEKSLRKLRHPSRGLFKGSKLLIPDAEVLAEALFPKGGDSFGLGEVLARWGSPQGLDFVYDAVSSLMASGGIIYLEKTKVFFKVKSGTFSTSYIPSVFVRELQVAKQLMGLRMAADVDTVRKIVKHLPKSRVFGDEMYSVIGAAIRRWSQVGLSALAKRRSSPRTSPLRSKP